jgi:hypothetical protein
MGCTGIVFHSQSGVIEKSQKTWVRVGVTLRVIQNGEVFLKIRHLKCRFLGKWTITTQANHEFILPQFLHSKFRVLYRQRDQRSIYFSGEDFSDQLNHVAVCGSDGTARSHEWGRPARVLEDTRPQLSTNDR